MPGSAASGTSRPATGSRLAPQDGVPARLEQPAAADPPPQDPPPPQRAAPTSAARESGPTEPSATERLADEIYRVRLDVFEGPLDLLLHLIQKHELDIFDIPVSFVTQKYLEYLDLMCTLQIDVASEYLVMAATLAHIKSQLLLPEPPAQLGEGEEGAEPPDPRAELVRRLLEYQKYRDAAARLAEQPILGRDVFARAPSEPDAQGPAPFAPVSSFKLYELFDRVLKRAGRQIDHEVVFDRVSITDRIVELTELLHDRGKMRFEELLLGESSDEKVSPTPHALVVTFLAMLEMCRLGVARILQEDDSLGEIYVEFAARGARLRSRSPEPRPAPEPALPTPEELEQEELDEEPLEQWLAQRASTGTDAEPPAAVDATNVTDPTDATDQPAAAEPPSDERPPCPESGATAVAPAPTDGSEEQVP